MDELTKLRMAFDNFPIETKRYLTEVTLDGKTRLVIKTPTIGSGLEYYLAEYPDIKNFPPEELQNVKDNNFIKMYFYYVYLGSEKRNN